MAKSCKIAQDIVRIYTDANCYLIGKDLLIDCSSPQSRQDLAEELIKYTTLSKIKKVIFTHLHYDHISNFDLFPSAAFYASKDAVGCMSDKRHKINAILNPKIAQIFDVQLNDIESEKSLTDLFTIFHTPGHTSSSICLYYKKSNVFFTGDTYFGPGVFGRTDLPLSDISEMKESLTVIQSIINKYKPIIAPGHDY
jgi:glyoxylase-like metal-dependent hydrolase (beta-lactamase superfamily II)